VDRLEVLRVFALAVDLGSLSAVARQLRRSPASISRAIDSLEERLGTPVLERTTRSLRITEVGERYLVIARRVLADLDAAERDTGAAQAQPQGLLSVTAPIAFGTRNVQPIVAELLASHPLLRARLSLLDRVVNLVDEGMDVAVRIGHLPDSALIAVSVGHVRRVVVTSPRYLAKHGRPKRPEDLGRHRCIASPVTPHDAWTFGRGRRRRTRPVRVEPILAVNAVEAAIHSAADGLGIVCALSYQVKDALGSGALVRILEPYEPPPVPVHVVSLAANARIAKVRAFIDLAVPRLRRELDMVPSPT
jgi:DNA-binding transcriptional LysR family regulator